MFHQQPENNKYMIIARAATVANGHQQEKFQHVTHDIELLIQTTTNQNYYIDIFCHYYNVKFERRQFTDKSGNW